MKQLSAIALLLMITVGARAEWEYSTTTDPLDDSVTHYISTFTVDGSPGRLFVTLNGTYISIFALHEYVGTNNYGMIPAEWRFDKRESKSSWWLPNNEKTGALLNDENYKPIFIQNMKECNMLVIRFTKWNDTTVTMRFSLAGFTKMYNKYIGKSVTPSPRSE